MTRKPLALLAAVTVGLPAAISAAPVSAAQPVYTCTHPIFGSASNVAPKDKHAFTKQGFTCTRNP